MKGKKWIALMLVLTLAAGLTGCGEELPSVYVQNVGKLMSQGTIAPSDYFAGVVVSEDITQIEKDHEMTVEELLVKAGDDVKEGQPLFSYDTQQLQLSLDKQKLELEQLMRNTLPKRQQTLLTLPGIIQDHKSLHLQTK